MLTFKLLVAVGLTALILSAGPGQSNPRPGDDRERTLWVALKRSLTNADGEEYFASKVNHCMLPRLKGVVTSAVTDQGVSKIVLAMSDTEAPEATLIIEEGALRIKTQPTVGTPIEFEGEAIRFTKDPFMLTFSVDLESVTGIEKEDRH